MLIRSARTVSLGMVRIPFSTGTDSPVSADSAIRKSLARNRRRSAGTLSPDWRSTISPGTRSSDDTRCYGDYYQWGRNTDGHEKQTSATTPIKAAGVLNAGSEFIAAYYDWTLVDRDGSQRKINWSNTDGHYLMAETKTWNPATSAGAFNSPLKLPTSGARSSAGVMDIPVNNFAQGNLWSNSPQLHVSEHLIFGVIIGVERRSDTHHTGGLSVRCIQD